MKTQYLTIVSLLAITFVLSSCTTFQTAPDRKDYWEERGEGLGEVDLEDLKPGDRIAVKTTQGMTYFGAVLEIDREYDLLKISSSWRGLTKEIRIEIIDSIERSNHNQGQNRKGIGIVSGMVVVAAFIWAWNTAEFKIGKR